MSGIELYDSTNKLYSPVGINNPLPMSDLATPPSGVTMLSAASGNVANSSAVATLAAAASTTNYLTGFIVSGSGATAGLPVSVTVTGLLGGTQTYTYTAAVGALVANQSLIVNFPRPLPASAVNTAIVVTCPALGAGNTNNAVVAHGFRI